MLLSVRYSQKGKKSWSLFPVLSPSTACCLTRSPQAPYALAQTQGAGVRMRSPARRAAITSAAALRFFSNHHKKTSALTRLSFRQLPFIQARQDIWYVVAIRQQNGRLSITQLQYAPCCFLHSKHTCQTGRCWKQESPIRVGEQLHWGLRLWSHR